VVHFLQVTDPLSERKSVVCERIYVLPFLSRALVLSRDWRFISEVFDGAVPGLYPELRQRIFCCTAMSCEEALSAPGKF
jgi:hypothetical protein